MPLRCEAARERLTSSMATKALAYSHSLLFQLKSDEVQSAGIPAGEDQPDIRASLGVTT